MKRTYRIWNWAATIVAVVVLISAASRVKAFFVQTEAPPSATGSAQSAAPANAEQGAPAEARGGEKAGAPEKENKESEEEGGGIKSQIYLWVNFLIIFGAFWYLSKKQLGPYLRGRGEAIREEMRVSKDAFQAANERLGVVEQKLLKLDQEIASLRASALQEAAAERARIEELGKVDAEKVARAAELEITAAAKLARQGLRKYAAELAVGLAEKRIQQSMSPDSDRVIFRTFIEDLADGHGDGRKGGT